MNFVRVKKILGVTIGKANRTKRSMTFSFIHQVTHPGITVYHPGHLSGADLFFHCHHCFRPSINLVFNFPGYAHVVETAESQFDRDGHGKQSESQ